jgi:hypothetical protein
LQAAFAVEFAERIQTVRSGESVIRDRLASVSDEAKASSETR